MKARLAAMTLALVLAASTASGCSASPAPAEPAPAFTTEEEAFAAAEETYRAYVDALNQVDLSDPETFEAVYAWTTGEANANERTTLSQMHADGWLVAGSTAIDGFRGTNAELSDPIVISAVVCSDVSDVTVVDSDGQSVVSEQRPEVYALSVEFVESDATNTGLAITASNAVEDAACI